MRKVLESSPGRPAPRTARVRAVQAARVRRARRPQRAAAVAVRPAAEAVLAHGREQAEERPALRARRGRWQARAARRKPVPGAVAWPAAPACWPAAVGATSPPTAGKAAWSARRATPA